MFHYIENFFIFFSCFSRSLIEFHSGKISSKNILIFYILDHQDIRKHIYIYICIFALQIQIVMIIKNIWSVYNICRTKNSVPLFPNNYLEY